MNSTLSRYIARQFIFWFISVFFSLAALIALFDIVELLRRTSHKNIEMTIIVQMSAAKLPHLIQDMLPFALLFAAMLAFWRLAKSSELVVARAAGVSVWQIIAPGIIIALLIGIIQITVFSPFTSSMRAKYEFLENKYLGKKNNQLTISKTGLWLRQGHQDGQAVLHALKIADNGSILRDLSVFILQQNNVFLSRIDAPKATLKPGYWEIQNAQISDAQGPGKKMPIYRLPTKLTDKKIQESFTSANALSFWVLPGFIDTLEEAGFNATSYQLRFHAMLATPILLCAIVVVAACFSIQVNRRTRAFHMILGGISCGFLLYLLTNVIHALGVSTNLPAILAAWIPAGVSMMLGITALLHLEDG